MRLWLAALALIAGTMPAAAQWLDDKGVATDLVEIHISGPSRYPRQP